MRKMSIEEAGMVVGGFSCNGMLNHHTLQPCYFSTDNFAEFFAHLLLNHFVN